MKKIMRTKTILYTVIVFSVIPLILLIIILFYYTLDQNTQRELDIIVNAQNLIVKSVDNDIQVVESAAAASANSMDFLVFSTSSNRKNLYLNGAKIVDRLKEQYSFHSSICAVFLYNSADDYIYSRYFYNAPQELRQLASDFPKNTEDSSRCWNTATVEGEVYLLYQIASDYGLLTIIMNPNRNYEFKNLTDADTLNWHFIDSAQKDTLDNTAWITTQLNSSVPMWIACPAPRANPFGNIDIFQSVILFFICAFIMIIPVLCFFLQRTFLTPIVQLDRFFNQVKKQNQITRIPVRSNIVELRSFADNFNQMLDNLESLNKKLYEQRLDAARARLQFLQLQIRPHFYLNCLKNMYTQLKLKHYGKIEEMILALSNYFAQAFRDIQNYVTLKDELETCQSYIQLQNILERPITLFLDIDSRSVNVRCLPMIVVTFVENSIKHSAADLELMIHITAQIIPAGDGNRLKITVRNNGAFSDEALEMLNSTDPSEMVYKHEKIGISNVRYRLWLVYRNTAAVTFRNENSDAVVEIIVPFETD